MHPFQFNKYLRKITSILFWLLVAFNLFLFSSIQGPFSPSFLKELLNIPLHLYICLIALGSLTYHTTSWVLLTLFSCLMVVLAFLRTGNVNCFYHLLAYIIVALFVYTDNEKRRKTHYSLKIKTDNLRDTYNTQLSEYEKRQQLLNSLSKKIKDFFKLKNIATSFSYSLTLREITKKVTEILTKTIEKGDAYSFYLFQKNTRVLKLETSILRKGLYQSLKPVPEDDFNKWLMQQRQPLFIPDIDKDYRFNKEKGHFNKNIKSLIASPVKTENKILGMLRIERGLHEGLFKEVFSMEDLRLLAVIANLAALSIKNAQLFKETEELAIKDGLTSLYVVTHFKELSEKAIKTAQGKQFGLLMLDLDKFKNVNDTLGHLVGDMVLRKVAAILQKECPKEAVIGRYGGEEFVIILPDKKLKEAKEIAENIRKTTEATKITVRREKISITISIGIAVYPDHGTDVETLLGNADKALYYSKQHGRNKVSVC